MNKNKGHINPLLSRWLRGETGWKEESRLDNQAHEDEFLTEALEGYRRFPGADHAGNLDRLRDRLQQEKRRPLIFVYRAAAAIAVLVVAGGIFWMFNRQENELGGLAQTEKMAEPIEESVQIAPAQEKPVPSTAADDRAGAQSPEPSLPATSNQPLPEKAEVQTRADETLQPELEDLAARSEGAGQDIDKPLPKNESESAIARTDDKTLDREAAPKPARAKERPPAEPSVTFDRFTQLNALLNQPGPRQRLVQGAVFDGEGYPLIGATVILKHSGKGTVTDLEGRYSILADSIDRNLVISYTGYTTRELSLPGQNPVDVVMQENENALSEVVVTAMEAQKSKKDAAGAKAEPRGGYARLNRYLRKNLQLPDDLKADTLSGSVILKFIVEPSGKLNHFQVLQSLCPACDQEAIRVLREGPPWEVVGEQKPVEVILTTPFRRE